MTTPAPAAPAATPPALQLIDPKLLAFSLTNRKRFDEAAMTDFIANVKTHGVLTPIMARPLPITRTDVKFCKFEIVYGERRTRAALAAGLAHVPAVVRDLTDAQALEMQVVENVQREDIHPLDEAAQYQRLLEYQNPATGKKYTAEDIAAKVGKARRTVFARVSLLKLCPEVVKAFGAGQIDLSRAELLARLADPATQRAALADAVKPYRWDGDKQAPRSVRALREHLEREYFRDLTEAPFDIKIAYAGADKKPLAGPCGDCPKNTSNQPAHDGEKKRANVCTDGTCFAAKRAAHQTQLIAAHTARGLPVLTGAAAKKVKPHPHGDLNGYTEVDDQDQIGGKYQTPRKALGKDLPPVALLEDPHTKTVIEVVRNTDLAAALKAKGLTTGYSNGRTDNAAAKAREKSQREKLDDAREARLRAHRQVRAAIGKQGGLGLDDFRLVALAAFSGLWHEHRCTVAAWWAEQATAATQPAESATAVAKANKKPHADRVEMLQKRIQALNAGELATLLIDCASVGGVYGNSYGSEVSDKDIEALRTRYKVPLKPFTDAVAAERAAKKVSAKAKKTPAKKGKAK